MYWYVPEYVVFYIYFKILHHFDKTILYCIRTRILSQVNFLVYCYFYRYLVIGFLLHCISYLYFISRWLNLCMYLSGVDEIKNVNQSINHCRHTLSQWEKQLSKHKLYLIWYAYIWNELNTWWLFNLQYDRDALKWSYFNSFGSIRITYQKSHSVVIDNICLTWSTIHRAKYIGHVLSFCDITFVVHTLAVISFICRL